ncbi:MAG TPA: hypothetical protein VKV02_02565 [Acidobacteriaceae bacterium]|nr:hypothetical protein [Acidobacteriaceae bacterium]
MSRLSGHLPFAFAVLCSTGTLCRVAPASTITFDLGPSAQNYTLTGTGGSGGYGTYNNTQGACSTASGLTTCDLTGTFTGNAAGLTGGTYDFQTTYAAGTSTFPLQSTSASPQGGADFNYFDYSYFGPSLNMTLLLTDGGLNYSFALVTDGAYASNLVGIDFAYVSAVCGGTPLGSLPCSQGDVGLVSGATYSGAVTGTDSLTFATPPAPLSPMPEPSWLTLSGLPMLGYLLRRRKARDS